MSKQAISVPKATLEFVMKPKTLPSPSKGESLHGFLQQCREEVEILLHSAVEDGALPERTSLVQCVATQPKQESIDLSYDTVLKGDWSVAARACAGLCVINDYFTRKSGRSSHERARKFGNTDIGNIVVFHTGSDGLLRKPLAFQANLIEIELQSMDWSPPSRLLGLLKQARSPNDDDQGSLWRLSVPEVIRYIDRNNERDLLKLPQQSSPRIIQSVASSYSHVGELDSRVSTTSFLENICSDVDYLKNVSALSRCGQVVLCMPQVFRYGKERDGSFDLGLTLVLSGETAPTETELLQAFVVARTIAGIHTSIHGAVSSLERSIGDQVILAALGVLRHSAGNLLDKMAAISNVVAPHANLLKQVITGATTYACREALPIFGGKKGLPWKKLGYRLQPFEKDIESAILAGNDSVSLECNDVHEAVIDARLVPLIEELVRNLAKGPKAGYSHSISVTRDTDEFCINIVISGFARADQARDMIRRINSVRDATIHFEHSLAVRGLGAIVSLVNAMRSADSKLVYTFGASIPAEASRARSSGRVAPQIIGEDFANAASEPIPFTIFITKLRAIIHG